MSLLDQVVAVVPVATKATHSAVERNVLRHPAPATAPAVRHGALAHDTAGSVLVTTPPERVAVFLGPGATFEGIADTLLPLYEAAATGNGPKAPTLAELARALVVYNKDHLPTTDWRNHKVGMRLLLPVEIDPANGEWVVDAEKIRAWAAPAKPGKPALFRDEWRPRLRTPPAALVVPDPFVLEGDAAAMVAALAPLDRPAAERLGLDLREQALRNPFESVLTTFAVLRALGGLTPPRLTDATLAAVDGMTAHQAAELASTRAGNGLLRRFAAVLAAPPAGTDPARLARARAVLDGALFQGRTLVAHRELPQTPDQLKPRAGVAKAAIGAAADPPGGLHRLVLGRDLAVGPNIPEQVGGTTFRGPSFPGRVALAPYLKAAAARLNPAKDPKAEILLSVLAAIAPDLGQLDGVRARGPGLLAVGLDRWPAAADKLPALLSGFKDVAPDEFDLHFALHGLDVGADPAHPGQFRLLRIGSDGSGTAMDAAALRTFLGGTVAGGTVTFAPEWAARFRLPALVSLQWRRVQVVFAVLRLRPLINPRLLARALGPFPSRYELALDTTTPFGPTVTTALTAAITANPTAPSAQTLAGAVIDLTGAPARPVYAGFFDDETFNIGSMAKVGPMYAAYELRLRIQTLVDAAKLFGLDASLPTWWAPIVDAVRTVWPRPVAQGFPGLDTRFPQRFPDLDQIFRFEPGGTVAFRAGATVTPDLIKDVGLHDLAVPASMEFLDWMTLMILWSHNEAASKVIDALRFPYINGALRDGGFFDPRSKRGIWVSGNFAGGDWTASDLLPLSERGRKHYKPTTNFAGTSEQYARLLALLATGRLFDRSPTICDEVLKLLRKRVNPGESTPLSTNAFIANEVKAVHPVKKAASKIGIGIPAPATRDRKGIHDCVVLDRDKGATHLRYVAIVVGSYAKALPTYDQAADDALFRDFVRALDKAVDDRH